MSNLKRYSPQEIAEMAASFRRQLAGRMFTLSELNTILDSFKFCDFQGNSWTLGPLSGVWYRSQGGAWLPSPTPAEVLNGPLELDWLANPAASRPARAAEPHLDAGTTTSDPVAYLQRAVSRVADFYAAGATHSEGAESLLEDLYLVDGRGKVWALGVQSRSWYAFEGGAWQLVGQPPAREAFFGDQHGEPATFCGNCGKPLQGNKFCPHCGTPAPSPSNGESGQERVAAGLERFLTSATTLFPEPIVPAWRPPQDFPEPVNACPNCGAFNIGGGAACISCGRPLARAPGVDGATRLSARPPSPHAVGPASPPPARPKRRFGWVLAGGCLLVFLCAACFLIAWVLNDSYFWSW